MPSLNHLISNGGVCRTAPATPGLLNIFYCRFHVKTAATGSSISLHYIPAGNNKEHNELVVVPRNNQINLASLFENLLYLL